MGLNFSFHFAAVCDWIWQGIQESQVTCCYLEYFCTIILHLLSKPHDLHHLPVLSDNMFQLIEIEGHMGSFLAPVMCLSDLIRSLWKLQSFCSSVTLEKAAACWWKTTDKRVSPPVCSTIFYKVIIERKNLFSHVLGKLEICVYLGRKSKWKFHF